MKLTKSKLKEIIREVIKEEEESALDKARAKALNQKTKEREVAHKKKHADWYGIKLNSKKESITGTAKKAGKKAWSATKTTGRVAKALVKPDDSVIKYMKDDPIYKDIAKAYRGPKKKK